MTDITREVHDTVEAIKPFLQGKEPSITGAVLAELFSLWVAAHWLPGETDETRRMREHVMQQWVETVAQLVKINAEILGTDK